MKIKLLIAGICLFIIVVLAAIFVFNGSYIDTAFATEVLLEYYKSGEKVKVVVTDENDAKIIKGNLKGFSYDDSISCDFSREIYIILTNGKKRVTFYPACDECSIARVGESERYVYIKDRKALEEVLEKYVCKKTIGKSYKNIIGNDSDTIFSDEEDGAVSQKTRQFLLYIVV